MARDLWQLKSMQAAPLSVKVALTKDRIREWVNEYGEYGVYVSFSGGKDSTVLLTIAREMYPDIRAVFVDTGLEYPEIRDFVRTWDNVEWLKPKLNFKQVIEKYGYPFIGKEVSEKVYYAKKYLTWWLNQNNLDRPTAYGMFDLLGIQRKSDLRKKGIVPDELMEKVFGADGNAPFKAKALFGTVTHKENGIETNEMSKMYDFSKYKWLINSPFMISNKCCDVMKKSPVHSYQKRTGKQPMTAQMASESRLRTQQWIRNGCNGFDLKSPISNPMAFWTEQDVLLYIYLNKLPIASVYGEVVKENEIDGQLDFADLGIFDLGLPMLKTTGCKRTGCMFCGFGCHLDKPGEGRFERMKLTHPKQYEWIMKPWSEGGLGYKSVIDWLNEHGDLDIRY